MSRSLSRDRYDNDRFVDGYRLHVGDLPIDTNEREIQKAFEEFGQVTEVWHARSSCFSFVVYEHFADGERALREMDGRRFGSSRIRVTWAKPRSRLRRPRWESVARCYMCGARGHFSRECDAFRNAEGRRRHRSRSAGRYRYSPYRFDEDGDRYRHRR